MRADMLSLIKNKPSNVNLYVRCLFTLKTSHSIRFIFVSGHRHFPRKHFHLVVKKRQRNSKIIYRLFRGDFS